MKTLIIPGYSLSNKEWAEETADKLKSTNSLAEVYYWKHWTDNKTPTLENAEEIVKQIGSGDINIIAKSIGTLAFAFILPKIKKQINKVILCGLPLNDIEEEKQKIYRSLSQLAVNKILVIQNSEDRHGSFNKVKRFLKNINPKIKVISRQSDTHDYPYFNDFLQFQKAP